MIFDPKEPFFSENAKFSRLIKYYAFKLREPEIVGELWGFLWILKKTLNKAVSDRYIAVCIRNEFIRIAKEKNRLLCVEDIRKNELYSTPDFLLDLGRACKLLTAKENEVFKLRYLGGYSVDEIAKAKKISRQSADQTRRRAIAKIRQMLRD